MTDAPHTDNKQLNALACARLCAVWILMREKKTKRRRDGALRLSPMVSGRATATLHDPDASSHTQIGSGTLCDRCLPWRSVPGMSAAGTHTKRKRWGGGGGVFRREGGGGGGGGWRRETGGSTEEKMDGTREKKTEGKRENRKEVCVCPSEVGRQTTQRRDPLCHVSVRRQTSRAGEWRYKFRHTSSCDSHPGWPRGGAGGGACSASIAISALCKSQFWAGRKAHWIMNLSESTVKRLMKLKEERVQKPLKRNCMTSAQWLSRSTFGFEERKKKQMRRWELIIASQQDGQKQTWLPSSSRRHKGNLLPPPFHHNPIERLLAFVMIYKVTSQTDLLWQPERDQHETLSLLTWPDLRALLLFPFSSASSPLPPVPGDSKEWGWLSEGRQQGYSTPLRSLNTSPLQTRGKRPGFVEVSYLKRQRPLDKDLVTENLWHGLNVDTFVQF